MTIRGSKLQLTGWDAPTFSHMPPSREPWPRRPHFSHGGSELSAKRGKTSAFMPTRDSSFTMTKPIRQGKAGMIPSCSVRHRVAMLSHYLKYHSRGLFIPFYGTLKGIPTSSKNSRLLLLHATPGTRKGATHAISHPLSYSCQIASLLFSRELQSQLPPALAASKIASLAS